MLKAAFEYSGNFPEEKRTPAGAGVGLADPDAAASLKNIFLFLSLVFRYPRGAVYAQLERLLPVFGGFFEAYCRHVPELPAGEELQAEYIRLFVNGLGRVPAPPYASIHIDGGVLMGPSYHRLVALMERTGSSLDPCAGEIEDHLAILLEYGATLVGRLMEGPEGDASQEDTLDILGEVISRYLRPIAKPISDGISASAACDFYTASARALVTFISDAEAVLSQIFGVSASEE